MQRLAFASAFAAFGCFVTPAHSADLDRTYVREREEVIIDRPAPPIVRERIVERHYYEVTPERYYAPRPYTSGWYRESYWRPHTVVEFGPFWRHRRHYYWGY